MASLLNIGRGLVGSKKGLLPSGYTQLEYIKSTGTQYIDTGIVLPSTFHIKMKVRFSSFASQYCFLCGVRNYATLSGRLGMTLIRTSGNLGFDVNSETYRNAIPNIKLNTWYTVEFIVDLTGSKFLLDGELKETITKRPSVVNYSLYLFDANTANTTTSYMGAFDLCDFQISGLANYIPCKNFNDVVGMYDMVEDKFYSSPNGTAFIAGPEV